MRKSARLKLDLTTFDGRIAKQGYHKVGSHSAAKACKYLHDYILDREGCYKHQFYGINSHRCLQCSPVLQFCNLSCRFCWRLIPETKSGWLKMPPKFEWDPPAMIADRLIEEQKRIASGYGGNLKANKLKAAEAMQPKHVALSLIGEPTMYPRMGELLAEFHKRGMTTFLVSNGTLPDALIKLEPLPTQMYISMISPDKESYANIAGIEKPLAGLLWEKYLQSLDFLASGGQRTRTVLRMTIAKGLNDHNLDGYAALIKRGQPHYVEVKSMVYVGGARKEGRGLQLGGMLSMAEIESIAQQLAVKSGYIVADRHAPSRVVLLCRDKSALHGRLLPSM